MHDPTQLLGDPVALSVALEALLFAHAEPMSQSDLRRVLRRYLASLGVEEDPLERAAPPPQEDGGDDLRGTAEGALPEPVWADGEPDSNPVAAADTDVLGEAHDADAPRPSAEPAATPEVMEGRIDLASAPSPRAAADAAEGDEVVAASEALDEPATADLPESAADDELEAAAAVQPGFELALAPGPRPRSLSEAIRLALDVLERRWQAQAGAHGFELVRVADGYTFRSLRAYGPLLAAVREERPQRLSRPALESLSIVAYKQPVTKPEVDALRGVDCGGTMKLLLERGLIAAVGKKDEPGRPLLYGTTPAFLSLFNLPSLTALPSLREYDELNADSEDALRAFDGLPSLAELSVGQKQFLHASEPSIEALDDAVGRLKDTEQATRAVLADHGVSLATADGEEPPAAAATLH